ncbi:hypothetical protein AV274_4463 [Blastocystis sp. ATCC 50177/Nand II]|uniref:Uncharacterized protein n=1 Tax=Blastocystis sp. subtype 1 (strain ATCC 50177 / NandII) TaxID=478820 RepID=A0A196S9T7_BLAHN|nr:hypothetical protein AV274_4463 [Blastocystis sp. ATCC 50177/Nand II]
MNSQDLASPRDEDESECYKRRKVDGRTVATDAVGFENDEEYKRALEILKKKKEDRLLLIRTHLELKKEAATLLAQAEEQSLDHFYTQQQEEIQKALSEERQMKTRRMAAEETKQTAAPSLQLDYNVYMAQIPTSKKEQCVFSVPLDEESIVDDLLFMAHDTMELYAKERVEMPTITAPVSYNRLLLNDRVIFPNTRCTLYSNGSKMCDCTFVSTIVKEKETKEKRKEPEFVVKVSATRKRRFPIESLRNGEMQLEFNASDVVTHSLRHYRSRAHDTETDSEQSYE